MKLYNSLTQTKETFKPRDGKTVTMYVCGITPYDTTHLGHAFTYTFFDVLQRYFIFKGYRVRYTQNVTDIDDDLLRKAKEVKQDWQELGEWWTQKYLADMKVLNNNEPMYYVKATDTIEMMITMIRDLQTKELAYEKDGTVFFRTKKDPEYGKLSQYTREEMIMLSRERGANPDDARKEDPLDFILWQRSEPDEPSWDSPWGKGRPGWHIECSAMIYQYLDKNIDIHGGGHDLIYPHHESEISQSENFTGEKPLVKYWMHTGAVHYEGKKMSKSLGNLVMISDLLQEYSAQTIRWLLLSHHYREAWEYTEGELKAAEKQASLLTIALTQSAPEGLASSSERTAFTNALDDDMNTPQALEILHEAVRLQLAAPTQKRKKDIHDMASLLGLL